MNREALLFARCLLAVAAHRHQRTGPQRRTRRRRSQNPQDRKWWRLLREISPFGYVPLLELDDGTTLREGPVIIQYLADLKPQSRIAPTNGTLERYRLQEWLSFLTSEIHKGFIPLLYARLAGTYGTDTAKPKLAQRYRWIDTQLAGREYLMGENFTVADAYLYALTQWGQAEWLESVYHADIHFDGLANLQGWYCRMRSRPAVRRSLDAEGLK